ncbi:MAG: hypothetical protein LAT58_12420 [Opitutales bacterium]|nr:hypothetical protein [Opitutales bacterium]
MFANHRPDFLRLRLFALSLFLFLPLGFPAGKAETEIENPRLEDNPPEFPAPLDLKVSVSGEWRPEINQSLLRGGAGKDLIPRLSSEPKQIRLSVEAHPEADWHILVYREDLSWDPSLQLDLRQTFQGPDRGRSIWGGQRFTEVHTERQEWLSGTGPIDDLPLQFRLRGISVQIPPENYQTAIIFLITQR